ncbi:MAG: GTPase Era [Saprospiraceae bacterium]|nr:GTPase Era [Saprospiraceae bacterium]
MESQSKAGFVNIIGLPNSGKSTLFNALLKTKLAIVTHKPQTTRQRVIGILNQNDRQLILSDTPGWIEKTSYPLHKMMNIQIKNAMEDAETLLLVVDASTLSQLPDDFLRGIKQSVIPFHLCLNKMDIVHPQAEQHYLNILNEANIPIKSIHRIQSKTATGIEEMLGQLFDELPVHPPYYYEDISSDRSVRFFISEMIREQILFLFDAEIPYHVFVVVDSCKGVDEEAAMAHIYATIYVGKSSHVSILIGKNGQKLKELGIHSRKEIESFLQQKVYLNLSIKLKKEWRDNSNFIQKSGIFQ